MATPIGNLEDITLRALRVLREADVIAAEDTRHVRKLLGRHNISRPLIGYWGAKEKARSEEVMEALLAGKTVALVSDAGTPGLSDPGSVLIGKAIEAGLRVVPVPGPSALTAALSASGFPASKFVFTGFLPPRKTERAKALAGLAREDRTMVFFEAPHRLLDVLKDMHEAFGPRQAALCKELTKLYEEVTRGDILEILDAVQESKVAGEYVIVVEGKKAVDKRSGYGGSGDVGPLEGEALDEVRVLMKDGLGRKQAVSKVAVEYGMSKKGLYERSLKG